MRTALICCALSLPVTISSCGRLPSGEAAGDARRVIRLTFGVYVSDKPTTMYEKFKPASLYLEQYLSKKLSAKVKLRLRIFADYQEARDALVEGQVDFARFGPASYILAKERARAAGADVRILVVEEVDGEYEFRGVIFTTDKSNIRTINDIVGRRFAFGDRTSTIGRYLSQAELMKVGIKASDLKDFQYLDRHDKVVTAVLAGKFDAGAAKEDTFNKYEDRGLRVITTFPNATKPWVAHSELESEIFEHLRRGLLEIEDKTVLEAIGKKVTGFGMPDESKFDVIRAAMRTSEDFGTARD